MTPESFCGPGCRALRLSRYMYTHVDSARVLKVLSFRAFVVEWEFLRTLLRLIGRIPPLHNLCAEKAIEKFAVVLSFRNIKIHEFFDFKGGCCVVGGGILPISLYRAVRTPPLQRKSGNPKPSKHDDIH